MTRNLVFATAALAAAGWLVASSPTSARYVLSGLQEYANTPMRTLTQKDCRVIYNGELRLVSADAFAKYLARHPGEAIPSASRRYYGNSFSSVLPPRRGLAVRGWASECER